MKVQNCKVLCSPAFLHFSGAHFEVLKHYREKAMGLQKAQMVLFLRAETWGYRGVLAKSGTTTKSCKMSKKPKYPQPDCSWGIF